MLQFSGPIAYISLQVEVLKDGKLKDNRQTDKAELILCSFKLHIIKQREKGGGMAARILHLGARFM
jgi:hypothetical protein